MCFTVLDFSPLYSTHGLLRDVCIDEIAVEQPAERASDDHLLIVIYDRRARRNSCSVVGIRLRRDPRVTFFLQQKSFGFWLFDDFSELRG